MALAILEFLSIHQGQVNLKIDTGTNPYYYLKIGESITERNEIRWVDGVKTKTALKKNAKANTLLDTDINIAVPLSLFPTRNSFVQLFSFKNTDGKSPAFSRVVKIPMSLATEENFSLPASIPSLMMKEMRNIYLKPHRLIPHKAHNDKLSRQSSLEDILSGVVRVAGPIVMGLLSGLQNNPPSAPGGTVANGIPSLGMLNTILDSLLHGLGMTAPAAVIPPVVAAPIPVPVPVVPAAPVSTTHSLAQSLTANRFLHGNAPIKNFSKPFIFGIDDALIASLVGPVLQVLPQLANASNQARLQNKQANNQLVTDLVGEVNRRMMLQQFLQNQASQPAGTAGVNIQQLLQLLQQATPTAPASVLPVAAPSVAASLTLSPGRYVSTLSTRTILSFEVKDKQNFCEKEIAVYQKNGGITLQLKLIVAEPAPKTPLAKSIVKFVFRDENNTTVLEKIFKQKDVLPNTTLNFSFSNTELNSVLPNKSLTVIAEMRWLTNSNREIKTLGTTEIAFADSYFIKEQSVEVQEEQELKDMKVYRAFWNKLWESPLLDKINKNEDGYAKFRWRLDTSIKYTVVISSEATSNGLMETKLLKAENEQETLSENIEGRIKGGIELSIEELNKMATLWQGQLPLAPDKLAALKSSYFCNRNTTECISSIKMTGRNHERGLLWIIPTLKLNTVLLQKINKVNELGQVTETEEEKILFPLPKSARIMGLKTV